MLEKTIYDYLTAQLSVPVYTTQPDNAPASYVLFERVGGGVSDHVPSASVALQSYGPTLYEAAALNEELITAMDGIVALPSIGRCKLENTYNYTDIERKRYRYQAVYDIRYY